MILTKKIIQKEKKREKNKREVQKQCLPYAVF